ncbi:MAG: aminotransferase class I/II-fold pyridoxal phosphate-dependent enzyme, partial [Clostridia bacterium]|nr:aminotransferase class I/II-fold pyridoxal phosphate-dependent enzyme [Clostridia bacterium]
DEIYAELTFGKKHVSIATLDGMWERTIIVSGFSKAYAMTGWRLGYLCAPAPLAKQMLKIHQYAIMCAPTTAQFAAEEALRNGDEVIIPMPSFVCYEPIVRLSGGTPVIINTTFEDKFKLTAKQLKAAITDKTKLLVLPYPNNPTGAIMDADDLEEIAAVLRGTNIAVLSDEIYAELTFGKKHVSIATLDGMWERTIIVSGFSKAYAMTGWRLGYLCAPAPLAKQMLKIHQYAIMCAPTTAQFAAEEALRNGDEDIEYMAEEYDRRRRYIYAGLAKLGIECFEPEGAFYIYPYIGKFGLSSEEFCQRLLVEQKCAIVPGTAFGACGEGFARISYAYSVSHITEALEKIERFLKTLEE